MTIKQLTAREWRLYIVALLATIYVVTWRVLARPRDAAEMEVVPPPTGTMEASRVPARPQLVRARQPQLVRAPQPQVVRAPRPQVVRAPQPQALPSPRPQVVRSSQPQVNRPPPRVVRVPARRTRTRSS